MFISENGEGVVGCTLLVGISLNHNLNLILTLNMKRVVLRGSGNPAALLVRLGLESDKSAASTSGG